MNSTTTCMHYIAFTNVTDNNANHPIIDAIMVQKAENGVQFVGTSTDGYLNVPKFYWNNSSGAAPYKSVCTTISDSSGGGSVSSTSTLPVLGSMNFGLAVLVTLAFFCFLLYIWNIFNARRKPWQK